MVDITDIGRINMLYQERSQIEQAIKNFDAGGRINSMIVIPPPPPDGAIAPLMTAAVIPTHYINYPAQMVEGIKQILTERMAQIDTDLQQLGIGRVARK